MQHGIKLNLLLSSLFLANLGLGEDAKPRAGKTFIDYFLPIPIVDSLSTNLWGAPEVGPRDPKNGLEDATVKQWCYWDGQIIKVRMAAITSLPADGISPWDTVAGCVLKRSKR